MHRAGLETFLMNVYRNIDRTKVQFDFMTHYTSEDHYDSEIKDLGGKIHKFSVMEDYNLLKYFKELKSFFKEQQDYNIIHGHWTTFGLFYMYYAKKYGVSTRIAHSHSSSATKNVRGFIVTSLAKLMKYKTNHYFACSQSAAKWLYGNDTYVRSKKIKIINNAIDLDEFEFDAGDRLK